MSFVVKIEHTAQGYFTITSNQFSGLIGIAEAEIEVATEAERVIDIELELCFKLNQMIPLESPKDQYKSYDEDDTLIDVYPIYLDYDGVCYNRIRTHNQLMRIYHNESI